MSSFTQFFPKFTAGQIRYLVNGSDSIPGYLKCDGSILSQTAYPKLYSAIGLLPNNVDFTTAVNSSGAAIYSIIYANGQYVRVGAGGRVATSPDAVTWTAQTSGTSAGPARSWRASLWAPGACLRSGASRILSPAAMRYRPRQG